MSPPLRISLGCASAGHSLSVSDGGLWVAGPRADGSTLHVSVAQPPALPGRGLGPRLRGCGCSAHAHAVLRLRLRGHRAVIGRAGGRRETTQILVSRSKQEIGAAVQTAEHIRSFNNRDMDPRILRGSFFFIFSFNKMRIFDMMIYKAVKHNQYSL